MIISHESQVKENFHNFITVIYTIRITLKAPFVSYHRLGRENCTFIVDSGVLCIIKDILFTISYFQHILQNDSSVPIFIKVLHVFHTHKKYERNMLLCCSSKKKKRTLMQTMMKVE